MFAILKRWRLQAEDRLKYNPLLRGVLSSCNRWYSPQVNGDQQALAGSIRRLCTAARFANDDGVIQQIEGSIRERLAQLQPAKVNWSEFVQGSDQRRLPRAVLLKPWLGHGEKGVLFVSFEKEWFRLLCHCNLRKFSERYELVVAPSGDPNNLLNCVFAAAYPGKLFTLISNAGDAAVLPRLAANFIVLPLYASHWVLPELFEPRRPKDRDIDLIMVANFAKFKRHHLLFAALRKMPARLRVLLIGQDQDGRNAATIEREAAAYGVAHRITAQSNVCYAGVAQALCRARASVILSRREGSCVAVAEALFANTPTALLRHAEIGSRAFIHPQTGVFLDEHRLAWQLTDLIERAETFAPRQWADSNISCHCSSRLLNDKLRQHTLAAGQQWTLDIAPLCWRPDPCLVRGEDAARMQAARQEFQETFGIEIGPAASQHANV